MKSVKVYLAIASVVGVTNAQTLLDLRSQVKNVDFSRAAATKPFKSGAALPATCSIGEAFFPDERSARKQLVCVYSNQRMDTAGRGSHQRRCIRTRFRCDSDCHSGKAHQFECAK